MFDDIQILSESEAYKQYDEYLDTVYEGDQLAAIYGGSTILKQVDPTAYTVGFSDWCDGENIELEEDK